MSERVCGHGSGSFCRSTQRKMPAGAPRRERLTGDVIELARQYGRYGYCCIDRDAEGAGWLGQRQAGQRIGGARG